MLIKCFVQTELDLDSLGDVLTKLILQADWRVFRKIVNLIRFWDYQFLTFDKVNVFSD